MDPSPFAFSPAPSHSQALQQVVEGPAADHYSHCFLTLRALLQLGRWALEEWAGCC